jgi:hypothetical protein
MKMVKSLLLGSAAGLVAVAGAQAADLPVKAKPVEYVKVCSLYGVGFYYIPGTDTCIKIGGFVRHEWMYNAGGSFAPGAEFIGARSGDTRVGEDLTSRSRGVITWDTRTQTAYGTLRSYFTAGLQWTTGDAVTAGSGAATFLYRAFIQFAGFTFGLTQSFYDFYSYSIHSNQTNMIGSDSGGTGTNVVAYTAQFGNGFSASISLEDNTHRRQTGGAVVDLNTAAAFPIGAAPLFDQTAQRYPDIVANLRVDQAWGSAQISGALHESSGAYWGAGCAAGFANTDMCGHPGDKWGYAFQGGVILNLPWAKGDTLALQAGYGKGTVAGYVAGLGVPSLTRYDGSPSAAAGVAGVVPGSVALAWLVDGVFAAPGSIAGYGGGVELTSGWALQAGIQHYWTPSLRTSLWGGYMEIDYGGTATSLICASGALPMGAFVAGVGFGAGETAACDPDFKLWQIGSRTIWNPVANLDVGVEVLYTKVETEWNGTAILPAFAAGARPAGLYNLDDQGVWSAMVRVQRNFWP